MKYYVHTVLGAKHFPESSNGMLILDITGLLYLAGFDLSRHYSAFTLFFGLLTFILVGTVERWQEIMGGKETKRTDITHI